MVEVFHHRATLKQKNKAFKSKHATKSSLKDIAKGRVQRQSSKLTSGGNAAASGQARFNRRNNAKQAQDKKRQALVSATRIFNGSDGAPRIVAVVPVCPDVTGRSAVVALAEALDVETGDCPEYGLWRMKATRFKTSVQFIMLPYGRFYDTLDACKAADYVLLLLSPTTEVEKRGDVLLRTLQAQGLPEVISVVAPSTTATSPPDPKSRIAIIKSLLSFMRYFVPTQSRVFDLDVSSDRLNAIRAMAEGKPADIRWRLGRTWLVSEQSEWVEDETQEGADNQSPTGTLAVTGIVRGASLSADRLLHLPGFGDYQVSKIMSAPLPRSSKVGSADMDLESTLLYEPDASAADSLVSTNDPDDLANEQTWPTDEEMTGVQEDDHNSNDIEDDIPDAPMGTTPRTVKRIPKGMSEYQATWIVEDDEEDDGGDGGEEDPTGEMDGRDEEEMVDLPHAADDDGDTEKGVTFMDLDLEEEERQLDSWRSRDREDADDLAFPDEIDTPKDVAARTRFQRYRGLRSFRTSPWDPYENLPRDYARIFQFEDFARTERAVQRRAEEETAAVQPGTRVTVYLKNVPKSVLGVSTIITFGLHQHEHKVTVINAKVQRNTEYDGSVRSKDPLVMCIGPRRLMARPIYSQTSPGKGSNNVHKFERYLRRGVTSVATVYAPVVFGNQPCTFLRETEDNQAPELVAMGSFWNTDTTRIVAKRMILTGHPYKVHRKTATIRYMFFNADDVLYFKPVQLHTKYGRIGHIRESLGTHGYFKAYFDQPVNQMDTVCMNLYKRVYPRWSEVRLETGSQPNYLRSDDLVPGDAMEE